MYNCGLEDIFSDYQRKKADAVDLAEGSRPGCDKASVQVSTGVLDQGMCSRG